MERKDPLKRLNVALLVLAFVLSLFAGRLVQLQGMDSASYAKKALDERLQRITLTAVRGNITDAQGKPLALTLPRKRIFADPTLIPVANRPRVAQQLSQMLNLDQATVLKKLNADSGTRYVPLADFVDPSRAQMVADLGIAGINSEQQYQRVYPGGDTVAANLLGFVNSDGKGGAGLELSLNKLLAGKDGHETVEYSVTGQRIPTGEDQVVRPVPGKGVRLTILQDIQWKAQEALNAQVQKTGSRNGSVIVMDPRNGQILAMASTPSYDPSNYGAVNPDALNNPAIQETFEPGSTNKVITAAAVMEKAGVTPDTVFDVPDHLIRYGQTIWDAERHPTRKEYFSGVLATSSNAGTMLASERVSSQDLYDYMRNFGYGQTSGLKLPGETPGILASPDKWSGTQRYTIPFGQGVAVNALQVASVYATIANHGVRVAPQLVAGTDDGHGGFTAAPAPEQHRVISDGTAAQLIQMLEGVVSKDGTGSEAQVPGYRVAGKTGTAERANPKCGCYSGGGFTASFAGFAPADDPQLVVLVVLQDPKGDHYGGTVAAPVFNDVMTFALTNRRIPPTGTKPQMPKIFAN